MTTLVSKVLADAEADVRRRYSGPITKASPTKAAASEASPATSAMPSPPPTPLFLLTPEDWTAVLQPLAADTHCGATPCLPELVRYTQLRCAELPMRLQMEALQTRRYEHLLRQHTRELVTLSEYVALVSRAPPTLVTATPRTTAATADAAQLQQPQVMDSGQLPSDLRTLLAPEEVGHRLERAKERVCELEVMLRQDAEAKVRCCQRMVLLSEYVFALIRRVRCTAEGSAEGVVAGTMKRARAE